MIELQTCEVCGEKWGSVTKCEKLDKRHCGFCCPSFCGPREGYEEHLASGADTSSDSSKEKT